LPLPVRYLAVSSHPSLSLFFSLSYVHHRSLRSFPTRRSSDLSSALRLIPFSARLARVSSIRLQNRSRSFSLAFFATMEKNGCRIDRKSTRLNSSHVSISYAVFCLKKKNQERCKDGYSVRLLNI